MNMDFFWKGWEWVAWALERPAMWLAAAVAYAPKTSLVVAVLVAAKALL